MKPNNIKGKAIWGKQGFGGYPGVKHTAKKIVEHIPIKPIYVEPFAGLGRTSKLIQKYDKMILNDKSEYALNFLRIHFKDAIITDDDFMDCILKHDSVGTVFFIDPPWDTSVYSENELTFCDRKDYEYYEQIIEVLPKLKGDWILASNVQGAGSNRMRKLNYPNIIVESDKRVIIGKKARTFLMSNKPFIKHRVTQTTLI